MYLDWGLHMAGGKVFLIGNGESRKDFNLQKLRTHGTIYGCNAIYRDVMPDVLTSVDHGIMHEIYHSGMANKIPCYFRDWTKVPAMMYNEMIRGGFTEEEANKHLDDILVTNEREENDKEFVMHGANLKGIVEMIARNGPNYQKNVNHSTIKVSWIKPYDKSNTISDLPPMTTERNGDFGWSAGPTSGYVAKCREKPKEVFLIGHDLHSATKKVNNLYKATKHYVSAENAPTPCINWINQWYTLFKNTPDTKFYKVNEFNDGRDMVNSPIEEWEHNKKLPNVEYISYSTLDNMLVL